jgi:hypothetical protein
MAQPNQTKLRNTLETVRDFIAHKKMRNAEMNIGFNSANLNSTSWTTAAATGAGGPPAASDEQLRNLERAVTECMAGLLVVDQLSQQLAAEYSQVLKAR